MKWRELTALFLAGLLFYSILAWFQHAPGYMDADYYFAGGLRLVQGHGFTETYLWNFLDNPQSLPHPSHGYWFPLASMLAAAGMFITGQQTFAAGRLGFILVAALAAPVTAVLGFRITGRRETALAAGLLVIFSGYHASFMPTTDNFGLFMLLGGLFFLFLPGRGRFAPLLAGLAAGFMNLSRADGIIWLAMGGLGLLVLWLEEKPRRNFSGLCVAWALFVMGYLLVMGPWMLRNLSVWGTPLTPAGSSVVWMTNYDETFAWPPARINMQNWLATGWMPALIGRGRALGLNLMNAVAAQAGILLFPFLLAGLWNLRQDVRVRLAALAWFLLLVVMSIVFPFAGARGSFFHAGAALQPVWFTAAVAGLDAQIMKARSHGRFTPAAPRFFRAMLVVLMAVLTVTLAQISIVQKDWDQFRRNYTQVEQILFQNGAQPTDTVIVANSPGYFVVNGRSAVTVPDENLETTRLLAHKFGARYLVLEKQYTTDPLMPVFDHPNNQPGLVFLAQFDEVRVFKIEP